MTAVELLSQLIALDSTNPPGNEAPVAEVLEAYLTNAGMECRMMTSPEGRSSLVARLEGPPDRAAVVLLSHTDVVGVEADGWSRDPFGGEVADGAVWGRGALDMKGVAVLHAEAAAALAGSGVDASREVIVVAVADEEAGGVHGAEWLLREHPERCGFSDGRPPPEVVGEGAFGLGDVLQRPIMPIALGEKRTLWVELVARGDAGHGSLPPRRQAPRNLAAAVARVAGPASPRVHPVMQEQFERLAAVTAGARSAALRALSSPGGRLVAAAMAALGGTQPISMLLADTVTPTALRGGYKHNVVPAEASAWLDCRLLPDTDVDEFLVRMRRACSRHDVIVREIARHGGPVSGKGPLYDAIVQVSEKLPSAPVVVPTLSPAITDIRHFRRRGARGYGWVPVTLTRELIGTIHGRDERIPVAELERGVAAMTDVLREVAGRPPEAASRRS